MTLLTPTHAPAAARTAPREPRVVVVVGNPRPGSRTAAAATTVGTRIAAGLGAADPAAAVTTVDLSGLAGELLAPEHPAADAALATAAAADVLVVATPVHKASFTGLLKAFLDLYGTRGLADVVAVPFVVPGDGTHALVGEVHLRPVLVELGAVVPTASLVVASRDLGALEEAVAAWWDVSATALLRSVAVR